MKTLFALSQVVLIAFVAIGVVRLAVGPGAVRATAAVWRDWRKTFRLAVGIWLGVFVVDLVQTGDDQQVTRLVGVDYTGLLHSIEGAIVAQVQALFGFRPLIDLLSFAYLILFPGLLFGMAFAYDRLRDDTSLMRTALVFSLNYVLCIPFYLFFPVNEPWYHSPAGVTLLTDEVHPWLIDILRPMSGLDNCFPSYHTSLTISLVLLARETAPRAVGRFATIAGALIIASTVILGFHWVLDLLAGVLAGWFVHHVSKRLAEGTEPVPVWTRS